MYDMLIIINVLAFATHLLFPKIDDNIMARTDPCRDPAMGGWLG